MRRAFAILTCSLVLGCVGDDAQSSTLTTLDTSDSDTGDGDGDDGECLTPLPPEAFEDDNGLTFGLSLGGPLEVAAGSSRQFEVGLAQCCWFWDALETCSVYSVDHEDDGATMDPESGVLTLAADVPDGTLLTVTADVQNGLAIVQTQVNVFLPELYPLMGSWHEVARIPCGGGPEFAPADPIGLLYFTTLGSFDLAWQPFELYTDYGGSYITDIANGTITISNVGGAYVPDDIDGEGSFSLDGGELLLEDMWLGSSFEAADPAGCGHRFAR